MSLSKLVPPFLPSNCFLGLLGRVLGYSFLFSNQPSWSSGSHLEGHPHLLSPHLSQIDNLPWHGTLSQDQRVNAFIILGKGKCPLF